MANSDVRLQWDPDHDPAGSPLPRRALQLGLRGEMLRRFGTREILGIEDVTEFVETQRTAASRDFSQLIIPEERVYVPIDLAVRAAAGIDHS